MDDPLRWGVVGTMDEPAPLILAWVSHYLALGASEVHVFLDRENPDVQRRLEDVSNVYVTLCDESYWADSKRGERPMRHTGRQKFNATQVYQSCNLDWLLHCDADEFLDPGKSFEDELITCDARTLRIWNLERVRIGPDHRIFKGGFRSRNDGTMEMERIYGRWADFLEHGMAGYQDGKDITRVGEDFTMGVHLPLDKATGQRHQDQIKSLKSARLLHFDGLTPLHIVLKLLKRAREPKYQQPRQFGRQRERQFKFARHHARKPKQLLQMIDGVFGLSPAQADMLGPLFDDRSFDPSVAMRQAGLDCDLTLETFDRELRNREADLIKDFDLSV